MPDSDVKTKSNFYVNINGREMTGEEVVATIRKRLAGQPMPWWLKMMMPDRDGNGVPDQLDRVASKLPELQERVRQMQQLQQPTNSSEPVNTTVSFASDRSPTISQPSSDPRARGTQALSFERPKQSVENPISSGNNLADMPALKAVLMLGALVALGYYLYAMGIFS